MTEKPNSVCKWCGKVKSEHGLLQTVCQFEPVAEPAEPSASPCITAWPCYSYDHHVHICKLDNEHIGDHVCKCSATRSQPIQENPAPPEPREPEAREWLNTVSPESVASGVGDSGGMRGPYVRDEVVKLLEAYSAELRAELTKLREIIKTK